MCQTTRIGEARAISPPPNNVTPINQHNDVEYLGYDGGLNSLSSSSDSSDVVPSPTDVFRSKRGLEEEVFLVLKRANPINEYRDDYSDGACIDGIESALKRHRISYDQRDDEEDNETASLSSELQQVNSDCLDRDGHSHSFFRQAERLSSESKPNPFISKPVLIRNVTPRSED